MNNNLKIKAGFVLFFSLLLTGINAWAQNTNSSAEVLSNDSLSLKAVIEQIVRNHPTVKSAEEALKSAGARIDLAKTGYLPQVDLTANLSNIGPVIKLTIPDYGTFKLYPDNNYSTAINYRQVIYDFGRTRQNIEIEEENKIIGEQTLEQVRQRMSLTAINIYYTIVFLQEAVRIKDEQLATLGAHLRFIETMKATGAATDYQVLSTRVRISMAESQKSDLQTSLTIQQAFMSSLLGNDKMRPVVREELNITVPAAGRDSLIGFAFRNRNEILISQQRETIAGLKYQYIKSQNKPVVNFMATGGLRNGYIPDQMAIKPNYTIGIGFSVPLFDGMRTKYNLIQAQSGISAANLESENTKRNIKSEVQEAEAIIASTSQKVSQFNLQLEQAIKAYSLAETNFRAGTITNLELFDANTTVSESRLMLLKARIDYASNIYRLKAALGERLY